MRKRQLDSLQASLRAASQGKPASIGAGSAQAPAQFRADVDAVRHSTASDLEAVRDLHDLAGILGGELRKLAANVAYSERPSSELRSLTASLKDLAAVVTSARAEARTTIQDALAHLDTHDADADEDANGSQDETLDSVSAGDSEP